jgi:hypothetical protein
MPNAPLRELGARGIIRDVSPTDLPQNAFSDGINVRFDSGAVSRASAFRTVFDTLTGTTPVFAYGLFSTSGFDSILYANNDGRVFEVANTTETEITEAAHTDNVDPNAFTACSLAQCTYLNRVDAVPRVLTPGATEVEALPHWDSTWRCLSMRAYKNWLFAINVTKGTTQYPTMVAWGDEVISEGPPSSWDETDTTKLAGNNPISWLSSPLIDGGQLGDSFVLYTHDDNVLVQDNGGQFIFTWRRLPFDNAGIINQNCWIEIDGVHYVWGPTDIYKHDGVSKTSIIDQRNRKKFFGELNIKQSGVFFVAHDKYNHELIFCGVSGSPNAAWPSPNGYCNYGAVYNYVTDTWSFIDLPNVSSASIANVNTVWTYATVPADLTYATVGGTYFDQDDSFGRYSVFTSVQDTANGFATSKIHVLDGIDNNTKVALPLDLATMRAAWVQRAGLDFDMDGVPLRAYKTVSAVLPLATVYTNGVTLAAQVGGQITSASPINWGALKTFSPVTQYKIDTKSGGRFLAYRFTMSTANDFSVSGFDAEVKANGHR